MRRLDVFADDDGRITRSEAIGGDVAANEGVGADDRAIANGDPFEDRRSSTDKDVAANVNGKCNNRRCAAERNFMHV